MSGSTSASGVERARRRPYARLRLVSFCKSTQLHSVSELPEVIDLEGDTILIRIGPLDDGTPLFEVFRRKEIIDNTNLEDDLEELRPAPSRVQPGQSPAGLAVLRAIIREELQHFAQELKPAMVQTLVSGAHQRSPQMPRPRDNKPRCSDPLYDSNRGRYQVAVRTGEGKSKCPKFDSLKEAWKFVYKFRMDTQAKMLSVEDALEVYLKQLRDEGKSFAHRETTSHRIGGFLAPCLALPIRDMTPKKAALCYQAYRTNHAVATCDSALTQVRTFARWALQQKYTVGDFSSELVLLGTPNQGKPQLRLTETRKLARVCFDSFQEGNEAGLAVLLALALGLRASEIVKRKVRDIDDDGHLLWIDKTKSRAGKRRIRVPSFLVPMLLKQCDKKKGDDALFTYQGRSYVNDWTERFCKLAGVMKVTAQGLRGGFATLALEESSAPWTVARALGHASPAVTLGHYAELGSDQSGGAKRVFDLLQMGTDIHTQSVHQGKNDSK